MADSFLWRLTVTVSLSGEFEPTKNVQPYGVQIKYTGLKLKYC